MHCYRQISDRDRVKISRLKAVGLSISAIARKTGFNKSSISREFKRNSELVEIDVKFWEELNSFFYEDPIPIPKKLMSAKDQWTAESAIKTRKHRAWKANQIRRRKSTKTMKWVIAQLKNGWSPDQISGRSKIELSEPISHECIYNFIQQDRKDGGRLFTYLKRFRKRKRRLNHRSYAGQLPNRVFIDKRSAIVEKRVRLGDLEADLICGYQSGGYLLTVVDRTSRKVILRKLKTKKKEEVYYAICKAIQRLKVVRTLTVDNGKEFALHQEIAKKNKIKVYFTHPYTSQEKGTIENTNGIIRYHFNSKTNFNKITDKKVQTIEDLLNSRPRKVLKYLTPNEAHNIKLRSEKQVKNRCT